jgi:hypothetical protein
MSAQDPGVPLVLTPNIGPTGIQCNDSVARSACGLLRRAHQLNSKAHQQARVT